ncbi:hypothetical protein LF41_1546 [Lysobacter dokdonensis DS-58]|uniref:Phasin domain-containing protein n=1 Tax=Lysobacter dokdonensis DS-58 TaxID=1300345 RepID=A0A0A2WHM4_9GAMM|nr:phasin family protein [Lysobacter dokdonensis]KGQ18192.1 hypothetical protein LF41_1546 [Lysobacter dokdonensis DS-58]
MYQQINEQFAAASRQFADTAAQINRLAIDNATQVFGLQLAALEAGATATFAFLGEVAEVRNPEQLKAVWPKGLQVARETVERSIATGQDVVGRTLKTNEAIGQIAKAQFEAQAKDVSDKVAQATKQK